jgi:hypothetical protein
VHVEDLADPRCKICSIGVAKIRLAQGEVGHLARKLANYPTPLLFTRLQKAKENLDESRERLTYHLSEEHHD